MTTDHRDPNEAGSLRVALRLSEAWVSHRDGAKREVAALLGLPASASIHDIIAAIRGVIAERDELRAKLGHPVDR